MLHNTYRRQRATKILNATSKGTPTRPLLVYYQRPNYQSSKFM